MPRLSLKSLSIDALGVLLAIAALTVGGDRLKTKPKITEPAPHIFLWAWERPVDLRYIDAKKIGVAYLARSITLRSDEVLVRPRVQPLRLADQTKIIAVTRIETDRDRRPSLSSGQRDRVIKAITNLASLPNVGEIQIDFDATQSERGFYRDLLTALRSELPAATRLSITALASWCMSDNWISGLPVNEAVPMLFRMAADGKQIVTRLNAGDDFSEPLCRQSYGISLDEAQPKLPAGRSLYVFNPDAWTEESVREILESSK
jgi:hypothetical protein